MPEAVVTLQEAADRLKVHYMTAYRWVRRGKLPAFKLGGRLRVRESDLEAFLSERSVDIAQPSGRRGRTDWDLHGQRFHELLRSGAAAEAGALARKVVADGATVAGVYVDLITPALHRIGEDWARGDISVADEHRASEIARSIVARLGETFRRRGPARGTAVTLTPPGEEHGLASAMLADFLRGGGFEVHHLGANVPIADLRVFLEIVPTDVVCVSVTTPDLEGVLGELVATVEGAGAQTVVGGQGVDAALAERCGAEYLADPHEVGDVVTALLRRRR